jgi:hypothetical protein
MIVLEDNTYSLGTDDADDDINCKIWLCCSWNMKENVKTGLGFSVLEKDEVNEMTSMHDLGYFWPIKSLLKKEENVCFIMRVGKNFSIKFTYLTHACESHLDYASKIWNHHTAEQKLQMERVQYKFNHIVSGKHLKQRDDEVDDMNYAKFKKSLHLCQCVILSMRRILIFSVKISLFAIALKFNKSDTHRVNLNNDGLFLLFN